MKLYEIDAAIAAWTPAIDDETGELLNANELDSLQLEREKKLESIACLVKEYDAEATAIRSEAAALIERQKQKERERDSVKRYLELALAGATFETARVKVSYRKSTSVKLDDGFVDWALKARGDLLRYKAPEADKTAIKAALKAGDALVGAELVENTSMTIK